MASSAVLGRVLVALLEDYDIYDETTLATLIVDGDVAADIARRLRHDDFAAKLCSAGAIARGIKLLETPTYTDACVATASCTTRDMGSMATYLASGERGVSTASQAVVHVAQRASQANVAASVVGAEVSVGVSTADARTTTNGLVTTVNASTDHYLVLGHGLKEQGAQTTFNVTSLEETLASTLSALDSSQAAQLALEQRVAELERQLEQHAAEAARQTDVTSLQETLASTLSALQAAEARATMLTKVLDQRVQNEMSSRPPPPRPPPPRPPPPRPPPPRPPPPRPPPPRPPPPPPPHSQPPLPHNQPALPPPPPSSSSPQLHAHPPSLYPRSQSEA